MHPIRKALNVAGYSLLALVMAPLVWTICTRPDAVRSIKR